MERYIQIPHTADLAIEVYGKYDKSLFENAAIGMFDIMADLEGIQKSIEMDINAKAIDFEELLVSWLDELLFNFYTKKIIFFDFYIKEISENCITSLCKGRSIEKNRNRLKTEIKAITYHDFNIQKAGGDDRPFG